MSLTSKGILALGRLAALASLAGAFLVGLGAVVYLSLQGSEVRVPEITGKDLSEGEKELAMLGLKIKKRSDRISAEQPGTVIEQLPKAGELVKTGQIILVVTSKGPGEGGNVPPAIKDTEEDDSEKIEEMISEKPKKTKTNSNTNRKKADTTRDVNVAPGNSNSDSKANTNSNSSSNSTTTNSNKRETGGDSNSVEKTNRNTPVSSGRLPNPSTRPTAVKPSSVERPRKTQR